MKLIPVERGFQDFYCPRCGESISVEIHSIVLTDYVRKCPACDKEIVVGIDLKFTISKMEI